MTVLYGTHTSIETRLTLLERACVVEVFLEFIARRRLQSMKLTGDQGARALRKLTFDERVVLHRVGLRLRTRTLSHMEFGV
jgi:hypothetical protein